MDFGSGRESLRGRRLRLRAVSSHRCRSSCNRQRVRIGFRSPGNRIAAVRVDLVTVCSRGIRWLFVDTCASDICPKTDLGRNIVRRAPNLDAFGAGSFLSFNPFIAAIGCHSWSRVPLGVRKFIRWKRIRNK